MLGLLQYIKKRLRAIQIIGKLYKDNKDLRHDNKRLLEINKALINEQNASEKNGRKRGNRILSKRV